MNAETDPHNTPGVEVVDAEPVDERDLVPVVVTVGEVAENRRTGLAPVLSNRAAQAAALTLTGFAAGAVTALVSGRSRPLRKRRIGSRVRGRTVDSRSFVVDIHLLDR